MRIRAPLGGPMAASLPSTTLLEDAGRAEAAELTSSVVSGRKSIAPDCGEGYSGSPLENHPHYRCGQANPSRCRSDRSVTCSRSARSGCDPRSFSTNARRQGTISACSRETRCDARRSLSSAAERNTACEDDDPSAARIVDLGRGMSCEGVRHVKGLGPTHRFPEEDGES